MNAHRGTRVFVWLFLSIFCICGVFGFELWPMTGWRLFANARERYNVSWSSEAEYADGTTRAFTLHSPGSSDTSFLTGRLDELAVNNRNNLCRKWLELAAQERDIRRILIYRTTRDLADRSGDRSAASTQELVFVCQDGTLRPSEI